MAREFLPYDLDQHYLLPPDMREWLPEGHLAWFVSDVVDTLDLSAVLDCYEKQELRGRPGYDPTMLVKLLLYAYCVGKPSSRKIERATYEEVPFRVLAAAQHPDHASIAAFRRQHLPALVGLFLQVLELCRKAGLARLGHVALDGTKVRASASRHKAMSYARLCSSEEQLSAEVEALLAEADRVDDEEWGAGVVVKGKRGCTQNWCVGAPAPVSSAHHNAASLVLRFRTTSPGGRGGPAAPAASAADARGVSRPTPAPRGAQRPPHPALGYTDAWPALQPVTRDLTDLLARIRIRYRYPLILLRAMVVTDFKLRYQASLLGYLWTLLRPLAVFTILYIVFARFLRMGAGIPYYPVYLLFGIVVWGFFVEATTQGLTALVARADLLRKISFPRYVLVVSVGASVLISFTLNMLVIAFFMVLLRVPVRLEVLWLPLLFLELVAISISLAFFLSALYVRYRDVNYIWEVAMQAAFYAVPIIYPLTLVPARYARLLILNPIAQIVQDARYVLVTTETETISQLYGSPWVRAIPVGITLILVVASVVYFRRQSRSFAEEA